MFSTENFTQHAIFALIHKLTKVSDIYSHISDTLVSTCLFIQVTFKI